jgi:hypothetical protein
MARLNTIFQGVDYDLCALTGDYRAQAFGPYGGILEAGVDVRFADLPMIEGATGKFLLQQMAAVAELEAGIISARTKAALAAAKRRGVRLGGDCGARVTAGRCSGLGGARHSRHGAGGEGDGGLCRPAHRRARRGRALARVLDRLPISSFHKRIFPLGII